MLPRLLMGFTKKNHCVHVGCSQRQNRQGCEMWVIHRNTYSAENATQESDGQIAPRSCSVDRVMGVVRLITALYTFL
jgi:hypothetical protein